MALLLSGAVAYAQEEVIEVAEEENAPVLEEVLDAASPVSIEQVAPEDAVEAVDEATADAIEAVEEAVQAVPDAEDHGLVGNGILVENKTADLSPNNLTVSMDLILDNLRMKGKHRIILTPMVKGEDNNRVAMNQVVINGRRQDIEYQRRLKKDYDANNIEVRRKNGTEQSLHYTDVVPSEPWMRNCDIVVNEDLCGCGKLEENHEDLVWPIRTPMVVYMRPDAKPKTYELKGSAYIDFPVDKIELYPEYHRNPAELQKIVGTIEKVREDKNITINNIDICGFASPESPYEHNDYLASNRAKTLKDYVRNLMALDDNLFTVSHVTENWEGLRRFVEGSTLEHRAEILELIDSDMEPDAKEARIKSLYPSEYAYMLSEYYPWLRRSDYTITYTVRPFSVDEAREIFHTNPGQLSMEEMYLVAQTCDPDSEEFHEIFETAVRLFPDDPTANLNAACMEIERGDYEAAERHLAKAGENPYVWNARGVMAYHRGDVEAAEELYKRAADAGLEGAAENLYNLNRRY